MRAYVLCYDSFTVFEFILLSYFWQTKYPLDYIGLDGKAVRAYEKLCILPDKTLEDVNFDEGDLLVVPGGETQEIKNNPLLTKALHSILEKNGRIAAICGGVELLAFHGLITEEMNVMRNDKDLFINEDFILAKPNAYIDFAIETAKLFDVYQDEADYQETVEFFKAGLQISKTAAASL